MLERFRRFGPDGSLTVGDDPSAGRVVRLQTQQHKNKGKGRQMRERSDEKSTWGRGTDHVVVLGGGLFTLFEMFGRTHVGGLVTDVYKGRPSVNVAPIKPILAVACPLTSRIPRIIPRRRSPIMDTPRIPEDHVPRARIHMLPLTPPIIKPLQLARGMMVRIDLRPTPFRFLVSMFLEKLFVQGERAAEDHQPSVGRSVRG